MAEKMNPEIKARWVAALRSGEYKQGKSNLRSDCDEFCCLGVLSDLAVKAGVAEWKQGDGCHLLGKFSSLMPDQVNEWAGFDAYHGFGERVFINGKDDDLAGHNDRGRTFAEIADAIESQL